MTLPDQPTSYPAGPPPAPVGAAKRRPSAAWFAVGGALLLVAAIFFGVAVVSAVRHVHRIDQGRVELSGPGVHQVTVDPDVKRAVFLRGRLRCGAVDGTGTPVRFVRPDGHLRFGTWRLVATFHTGDGHLTLSCTGGGAASIVAMPSRGTVVSTLVLGLLVPMVLGLIGFAVLLVAGILWVARRPPPRPAPRPGPPPAPGPLPPSPPPPGAWPSA